MYLLILRRNQSQDLPLPYGEMTDRFMAWTRSLQQGGVLRDFQRLRPAAEAITLKPSSASAQYAAAEDVIGYYLLAVESMEAARKFAADCPILAAGGSVEIRETESFGPAAESAD